MGSADVTGGSDLAGAENVASRIVVHDVGPDRWDDLAVLFDSRGGPKACWCMVWRARGDERNRTDGRSRREALRGRIVDRAEPVGLLAYLDDRPVSWCSVAPRPTFRDLGGHEYPGVDEERIWSIVCFYVPRSLRQQGVATRLIQEAIRHARARGARVLEAYPVDPDSPSYRFMGFGAMFEAAGFVDGGRAGMRRHVMSLDLER